MNADYLLRTYRDAGAVYPLPGLSMREVRETQDNYRSICDRGQVLPKREQRVFGHLLHPWVAQLVAHPAVLKVVRALIGPDMLVWVSEFNVKPPQTNGFFSWHQDLYYWQHRYNDLPAIPMVTVWLALTDANAANGGMRVLPGSHSLLVEHTEQPNPNNMLTRAQHVRGAVDESRAAQVNLNAGEFSVHHPLLFHASGPNDSDLARIGLVTRYVAPQVVPAVRPAYTWLVSGEDALGNWDHVAPMDVMSGGALRQKCMSAVQAATGARFK
ncbi:phytanoyl-CoA dioxygenase family protein [Trinickia dinghuensis]|uniref:Phytanoyl-CoA dioxygenase family protein n=1 Tax=Trinickia dinghuensis TaxID=2291023 RepID=A0A3D8K3N0_9BURK|nr:phytanoyl-CoA dioxygenase family protein [Trinickia dinghuensis]RDV00054.1 phytanoyl-CoA dioxygenase family protein [Trinickia dinghuensis]